MNVRARCVVWLPALLALGGLACSADEREDAAVDGGSRCASATTRHERVLVDCATEVTLDGGRGSLGMAPPPRSECEGGASYRLVLASRELSWSRCKLTRDQLPWTLDESARTLDDSELGQLLAGLRKVTVWGRESRGCALDAGLRTMMVTTPASAQRYADSHACGELPETLFADNMDAAFAALSWLPDR